MNKRISDIVALWLAFWSKQACNRFRPYIIGVTGSTGKTTTKYMIGEIGLSIGKDVYIASGNLNTEIGLPLAILGFLKSPKNSFGYLAVFLKAPFKALFMKKMAHYLVLEYAADKPGDIEYLTSKFAPDVAVITNIGVAHIEFFKTAQNIKKEKWQLALAAKDLVVCHEEVAKFQDEFKKIKAKIITPESSNLETSAIKYLSNKTEFNILLNGRKYEAQYGFIGQHNLDDLILAILTASKVFGQDRKIIEAVETLAPIAGRGRRFVGKNEMLIIDESYNANPASMAAALNSLDLVPLGRKVVILGEMAEIDPIKEESHKEIALLAKDKSDLTIGVGGAYEGLNLDKWYPNVEQLEEQLDPLLREGDIVLVKGSFSNNLKKIIDKIK